MDHVYKITSINSGKSYIGRTTIFPMTRWSHHFSALRNGTHSSSLFQEEFNKNPSLTNWIFSILWEGPPKEAKYIEAHYISLITKKLQLNEPNTAIMTMEKYNLIHQMLDEGRKYRDIHDELGVSMATISAVKNKTNKWAEQL